MEVTYPRIFRLFIKEKFVIYVLWPLAKMIQNWIVAWSTSRNFTIISKSLIFFPQWSCFLGSFIENSDTVCFELRIPRKKDNEIIMDFFLHKFPKGDARKRTTEAKKISKLASTWKVNSRQIGKKVAMKKNSL